MATALPPSLPPKSPRFLDRIFRWGRREAAPEQLAGPIRGQVLGADRLAERARASARLHKIAAPVKARGPGPLLRRLDDTRRVLAEVHHALSEAAADGVDISSAGDWLLDNYYIVQEHMREIRMSLPSQYYQELPKLSAGPLTGFPRVYAIAIDLISHTEGRLDLDNITLFTSEYQRVTTLRLGELWAIPTMLRLGLLENIRRMALRTDDRLKEVQLADTWAERLRDACKAEDDTVWKREVSLFLDEHPPLTPTFVARFLSQIRAYQTNFPPLTWLEQWVAEDGLTAEEAVTRSNRRVALTQVTITNSITSLRAIARLDWNEFVESQSAIEKILRTDPAGVYPTMAFETRDEYRHVVEKIAKRTKGSEEQVARAVLHLAGERDEANHHVGYWLIDEGRREVEAHFEYEPTIGERTYRWVTARASRVYFGAIIIAALSTVAILLSIVPSVTIGWALTIFLLALIPASEVGVSVVNQIVTLLVPPRVLPKLEFRDEGIPEAYKTVVVVPTLFGNVAAVREALEHLEVQFLANRDPHLRFAVLSDFTDASTETTPEDDAIVDIARRGIEDLNNKYRGPEHPNDGFLLLHRPRQWSETQNAWMGWERKRGKLAQLNRFILTGDRSPFTVTAGNVNDLIGAHYVITLDSDTVLPRDSAHALVGAMAHPLNRPEYDPEAGRVVRGYGIMQPRVGVGLTSANLSKFAAIHSGHPGVDPYTTAVSDVYQDLYAEGSFTGKGIYDVRIFEEATRGRFPENTLLSHDLIEGAYARAALLTDFELYDDYPTRYLAYTRRKHRWIRGDWQILRWLGSKVPGPDGIESNRLLAISRWKIFDNLRRSLLEISQLLLLVCGWFLLPGSPLAWAAVVAVMIAFPWLFATAISLVRPPMDQSWKAYYAAVRDDAWTSLQQYALTIAFLPHQAVVSLDAIIRTLARMTVTRRNLLEWQTASQVERALKRTDREIYRRMWPAVAIGVAVGVAGITVAAAEPGLSAWARTAFIVACVPFAAVWVLSPAIAAALSAPAVPGEIKLSDSERAATLRYAKLHWDYFNTFVNEGTHWLAPDNFQEDPHPVVAARTSPTNIGLQLLSIVSAADLGFIDRQSMIERLEKLFRTLERLPRHRGHFYNWYDIHALAVLEPAYISTVDSGNLAGHFIALKQACIQMIHELQPSGDGMQPSAKPMAGGLMAASTPTRMKGTVGPEERVTDDVARLRAIADRAFAYACEMDFTFLFDERRKLFSIGFQMSSNTFDNSFYDLLASEARLASFIAIAKGDVSVEHWFRLGRSLTPVSGARALISWSGSMFEYLMPVLVMQSYASTLLDQTYRTSVKRQIAYGAERRMPWGVSESAYNVRDRLQTYQYRAFGVPDLALKRGLSKDRVVAPYATVLAMLVEPRQSIRNLTVLESEGALGPYGFRDAIDYTRTTSNGDRSIVGAFFAHHIGMSLVAFTNALRRQLWQRRFHADPLVRSNELVLHERIPRRLILQEPSNEEEVERIPQELMKPAVREMTTAHTPQPRTVILGNVPYTTMITNAGGGYSRYADLVVTRWRRDTTRDNQGEWIYLKDLTTGRVWSATYQPVAVDADSYHVLFAADRAEFMRTDGDIDTHTEVVVSSDDAAQVRRVTVTNRSSQVREIELTTYAEIVLQSLDADRQHPAFGNLFVETEWIAANSAILATRRPRAAGEKVYWAAHVAAVEAEQVGPITYETNRATFIGRGKSTRHPSALEEGAELSNSAGAPLDPIFSLRVRIRVQPGKSAYVSFTTFVTDTRDRALELADLYDDPFSAKRALELSWAQAQAELRDLEIEPPDAAVFQQLAGYMMYPHPELRPTVEDASGSQRGQQSLWKLGISGDLPILLATIDATDGIPSVRQLLQAHQYWRIKGLKTDLVILNEHGPSYLQDLDEALTSAVLAAGESAVTDQPGGVYIRRSDLLTPADVSLLRSMARVHVVCDGVGLGSLLDFPDEREDYAGRPEMAVPPRYAKRVAGVRLPSVAADERAPNGYGFFNESNEYEMPLHGADLPPAPWSNVVANPSGGFCVTESGSGTTWVGNSYFYRLTPWHNDPVRDPCSDCVYLRDDDTGDVWTATPAPIREPTEYIVKHGIGYSVFEHQHGDVASVLTVAMAEHDPVKITRIAITNNSTRTKRIRVTSYVEWVLGVSREMTHQFIRTWYETELGALMAQNTFNETYGTHVAFVAMSGTVDSYTGDRREFIGRNGTPARPAALAKQVLGELVDETVDPCGALQSAITLAPGETQEIIVLLGAHESKERASELVSRYRTVEAAVAEQERAVGSWARRTATIQVKTPDADFDRIMNGWLIYQALSCRMWGRSALYQSSGAYGFRDQLQDAMAFAYTDPAVSREHIMRASARQFVEGDVQHWWHPQTGQGVRTRFSDDLAWLPYVVEHYIRVTGDASILDERVPYLTMRRLEPHEHEIYDVPLVSAETGTVYEHCLRALKKACTFGERNLPLIGVGDWNDGFSRVGVEGKGQSVWLAWFLMDVLRRFTPFVEQRGDTTTRDLFVKSFERYQRAVDSAGWDGDWYIRAFFDDGTPLGSHSSDEAKIDTIAQAWSVIADGADRKRATIAMQSFERHLVRNDERLIQLLNPPFDKTTHDPGYIKGYLPGVRENGAQYTHGALWAVLATALQGRGTRAFELFQMLNPLTHSTDRESVMRYQVEPYVVAADVYTAEGHVGRGGWTWYTGSASWMFRVGLEAIAGFTLTGDQLTFNPCIPAAWDEFALTYRFGSTEYDISIKNPQHIERGVKTVHVDDVQCEGGRLSLVDDGRPHKVVVVMG